MLSLFRKIRQAFSNDQTVITPELSAEETSKLPREIIGYIFEYLNWNEFSNLFKQYPFVISKTYGHHQIQIKLISIYVRDLNRLEPNKKIYYDTKSLRVFNEIIEQYRVKRISHSHYINEQEEMDTTMMRKFHYHFYNITFSNIIHEFKYVKRRNLKSINLNSEMVNRWLEISRNYGLHSKEAKLMTLLSNLFFERLAEGNSYTSILETVEEWKEIFNVTLKYAAVGVISMEDTPYAGIGKAIQYLWNDYDNWQSLIPILNFFSRSLRVTNVVNMIAWRIIMLSLQVSSLKDLEKLEILLDYFVKYNLPHRDVTELLLRVRVDNEIDTSHLKDKFNVERIGVISIINN